MSGLDLVIFENVKPYFVINEDLIVVYAVDKKVRTSTRDWIGLFRKGWSKPEELIVFEWAIGCPSEETLPRRAVTFCSKDFSSRINPNDQYQFAYISKVHQVLGRSQYFLFIADVIHLTSLTEIVSSVESDDEDSDWLHISQEASQSNSRAKVVSAVVDASPLSCKLTPKKYSKGNWSTDNVTVNRHLSENVPSQSNNRVKVVSEVVGASPCRNIPPNCKNTPKKYSTCNWSTDHVSVSHHRSENIHSSATNPLRVAPAPFVVDTLAHPDLPPNYTLNKTADKKCPTCNRPSDFRIANNSIAEKVVKQAEVIVTQAEQIRSLESKLTAVQSELELCYVSQQKLKIKADMACREKENYCSFIGQFLESLKRKGQLKIVDSEGNTIMVKNVSPQVRDGQTTARKQNIVTSAGAPQCQPVNFNAAGDTEQRRRQELAAELRQVCRKYCEETESVQVGSTDVSEDTRGQLHSDAVINVTSNETSQDDSAQLTRGEQLVNDNELVNNQAMEDENSKELKELFHHS